MGPRDGVRAGFQGRSLLSCLTDLYPELMSGGFCAAAVGGGGKTGTLYALASSVADSGRAAALTTTTHIRDPRCEEGRRFDRLFLAPSLAVSASAPGYKNDGLQPPEGLAEGPTPRASVSVIASSAISGREGPRLAGIHPSRAPGLRALCDALLVEADGSRMLPVKAPAAHEPVLPEGVDIVLGLIGLDCLGRGMDASVVHRPELFGPLTGCATGAPIEPGHLRALAESPQGLFKGCPAGALRVLVLNKAELLGEAALEVLALALSEPRLRGVSAALFYSSRADAARVIGQG